MDEMIIPVAATREGHMQAAVTEGPEEGDPEAEAAGLLQRLRDQMWDGLATLELRTQPA